MPAAEAKANGEPWPAEAIICAVLVVVGGVILVAINRDSSYNDPDTFEGINPVYAACARVMGDLQKYSPEWGQAMKACVKLGGPVKSIPEIVGITSDGRPIMQAKRGPEGTPISSKDPERKRCQGPPGSPGPMGPKGDPGKCEYASQQHIYHVEKADFVVRFTRLANIVFMHTESLSVTTKEPWKPVFSITVPKCMAPYWDQFHIPVVRATCDEQGLIRICDVALGYRHPNTIELAWKRHGNGTGAVVYGGFSLTWPTYESIQCQPCPVVNE